MRYSATHKAATRRRILAAAGQAFRERGVAETGVDEVMRRAGLTHGGFYAHFADKTELVAEACAVGFAEAVPNLARIAAQPTPAARARLLIDSYLAVRHRDNRSSGCLIVAVAADMARLKGAARTGYSRSFISHLDRLADALRLLPDPRENHERVTQLMSALVGALLFARAIEDPIQSEQLLQAMRQRLKAEFCRDGLSAETTDARRRPLERGRAVLPITPEGAPGCAPAKSAVGQEKEFSPSHGLLRVF